MSNDLISRSALLEDFRNTISEKSDTLLNAIITRIVEIIGDTEGLHFALLSESEPEIIF